MNTELLNDNILDDDDEVLASEQAIDRLAEFLVSDKVAEDGMDIFILDGFLTAVVLCPDEIAPEEWMARVFGSEEPQFDSDEEAEFVQAELLKWHDEIVKTFTETPEEFEALLHEDEEGVIVFEYWAAGFIVGMEMRQDAWNPLFESEENAAYLTPVMAHIIPDDDEEFDVDQGALDLIHKELAENPMILSNGIIEIHKFWKEREAPVSGNN